MNKIFSIIFLICIQLSTTTLANQNDFKDKIFEIESTYGGKIGIAVINTSDNSILQYHGNDQFAFCSTMKFIVAGAVLKESLNNPNLLNEQTYYSKDDLVNAYSPYTKENLANGKASMSVKELVRVALLSDTTATNLLIQKIGGIDKVNDFAKSIGNSTFRLDRWEPYINTAIPGDRQDTSTPLSMAKSMQEIALGNTLTDKLKTQYQEWLISNNTGNNRIRKGIPNGWVVGDKTGTGDYGTTNDVAIIWPPEHKPIIISIYYTQSLQNAHANEKVLELSTKAAISSLNII